MGALYGYCRRHCGHDVARDVDDGIDQLRGLRIVTRCGIARNEPTLFEHASRLVHAADQKAGRVCLVHTQMTREPTWSRYLLERRGMEPSWESLHASLIDAWLMPHHPSLRELVVALKIDLLDDIGRSMPRAIAPHTSPAIALRAVRHMKSIATKYCFRMVCRRRAQAQRWLELAVATQRNPIIGMTPDGKNVAMLVG